MEIAEAGESIDEETVEEAEVDAVDCFLLLPRRGAGAGGRGVWAFLVGEVFSLTLEGRGFFKV